MECDECDSGERLYVAYATGQSSPEAENTTSVSSASVCHRSTCKNHKATDPVFGRTVTHKEGTVCR